MSGEQLGAACGEPTKQPRHPAQTGTVRETRAPPHTKRGQCANREHRPTPPEKDQNAQTEHLGMARSARGVFPNGCLRGISDAWRANLAANWRFSRPRPLSGCMERKTCHGLPPGNAPRRNLATASQAKGASGRNPATVGRWGTHRGIILPWQAARKCTAATPCHGSLLQECFSTTYCQEGPRLPELSAKSQWCHGVERRHQNEASANSTPRADTSKKP